jgi:hypothetical protein
MALYIQMRFLDSMQLSANILDYLQWSKGIFKFINNRIYLFISEVYRPLAFKHKNGFVLYIKNGDLLILSEQQSMRNRCPFLYHHYPASSNAHHKALLVTARNFHYSHPHFNNNYRLMSFGEIICLNIGGQVRKISKSLFMVYSAMRQNSKH